MRISRAVLLPLAVLPVLAAPACAEAATAPSGPSGPSRPSGPLVELREQGGFAGLDDRVAVYPDGCAVLSRRAGTAVRVCLTDAEWRGLRGSLRHLRLGPSQSPPPGADHIRYSLTYQGRRVVRYTLPATWRPVVDRLEKIMVKYRPR